MASPRSRGLDPSPLFRLRLPLLALLLLAPGAVAGEPQEEPAEPQEKAEESSPAPLFPDVDIFLPEGEFDFRISRLVDRLFFEGQLKYDFVDGDVSAFLRHRYYGYRRTYQLSVFDSIEFEDIEEFDDEFERARGVLLLVRWPHSFHHRTFFLAELDDISTNKRDRLLDSGQTNTFVRLGYQLGTPDDSRSNAIVGETRARVERLFTPYRLIGPGDAGFTTGLTWSFDGAGGDFDYVRLEMETLKRFELPGRTFVIGRLRGGTFPHKKPRDPPVSEDDPLVRHLIPRSEIFILNGRENLKGLDREVRGTEQVLTTWELLLPWFEDRDRPFLKANWQTWYWVLYGGTGAAGFDSEIYTDLDRWVVDAGVGFQSALTIRGYTLFLSALAARAFESGADVKFRLVLKSFH